MKKDNLLVGGTLLLIALLIVLDKLGLMEFSLVAVIINLVVIVCFIRGIIKRSIIEIGMSLTVFIMIHRDLLGITDKLPVLTIFVVGILVSVGLDMILGPVFKKKEKSINFKNVSGSHSQCGDSVVHFENVFTSSNKYLTSNSFEYGKADNVFGSLSIYFDDASLRDANGTLKVECVFGSVKIYVSKIWTVYNNTEAVFAYTGEQGVHEADGNSILTVCGSVVFGSVQIIYV